MQIDAQQDEEMEEEEIEENGVTLNRTPLQELVERVAAADDKKGTSKKKTKKRKTSEENEFDKEACESAMLWIRRAMFSRFTEEDKLKRGMTGPAISKCTVSLAKHIFDSYGSWLQMSEDEISAQLKIWFSSTKLEALLKSKKRKPL